MQVVVCGSNFGRHYLRACLDDPEFREVGLLGRGSERSKELARAFGVTLLARVDEVPASVRYACVAVPEREAEALISSLLQRGINVLAEHPVSVGLVDRASRLAEGSGATFHVNFHIADYAIVQHFIQEAVRRIEHEPPLFISCFTSPRCVHQLVDIIGRVLGSLRPSAGFRGASVADGQDVSLRAMTGLISGIPVCVQLTAFVAAVDDLSDAFLNHQISIGFASGNLVLVDTLGPVVWCSRGLNQVLFAESRAQCAAPAEGISHVSLEDTLRPARNEAIQTALHRLRARANGGECPNVQRPQYIRDVCERSRSFEIELRAMLRPASHAPPR